MMVISSLQNPKVKELIALRESKKRRELECFVIEGAREIGRALASGYSCRTLFVEETILSGEARDLVERLPDSVQFGVSKEVYAKAAVREGSDGVLAIFERKNSHFSDLKLSVKPFLLVLENLEKPGNFGALARTADGVGIDAIVVLDPKADLYNPHAIRASVGALFSQPLIACSYDEFFKYCVAHEIKILAASPHAKQFHFQAKLDVGVALVLGSEAWGLSEAWSKAEPIKIPMNGIADSLNVSVAGAVIMYEILRQRSEA